MFSKYLDPKNDLAFKKILGEEKHKNIPIAFLNAVFQLENENRIIDLEFLSTSQIPKIAARKESIVDVLVRDQKGSKYIIEMQVAKIKGFEKRAQYYAAKTYSAHFDSGHKYENLKKVVFLAITSYIVFPKKESYKSDHVILDSLTYENDLKDFSFTFVELPKFNKTLEELRTIEEKWYYFFKHAQETWNLSEILTASPEIKEAYTVLERTNWSERELLEYEQLVMSVADAEGAFSAAKEEGLVEGHAKGLAQGLAEADAKQREIVRNLLKKKRLIEEIAEVTGWTEEEILLCKN